MTAPTEIEYDELAAACGPTAATWDAFVREALESEWLAAYRGATPWTTEVLEIDQGDLVFLFAAAPTLTRAPESGDDRVVAVWGRSRVPDQRRVPLVGHLPPLAPISDRNAP